MRALKLLLDEHISRAVASGLRRRLPALTVLPLSEWESGAFLGLDDSIILQHALAQRLTFVTYDRRTIPPLLKTWAESSRHHAGIIFVDERTISPSDIGGLVRALLQVQRAGREWDWTDRVIYLSR